MPLFNVGDEVRWTSSSNGTTKEKTGTVIEVVPARKLPSGDVRQRLKGYGLSRQEESYVVEVFENPEKGTGRKLYWPRPSALGRPL